MSSGKGQPTKKPKASPKAVSDFAILPLSLPTQSGLPADCANAKHYLYVKLHEPSHPDPNAERSLFLSNVPIDANETSIRALFTEQLGGSRVEQVDFDTAVPAIPNTKRYKADVVKGSNAQAGRKRKRDEEIVAEGVVEDEDSALPLIWPGELRTSGGCAVVVFVDRASCKGAWKEVRTAVKEGRDVKWEGGGVALGLQRYKQHHALTYPSKALLQSSINAYLSQFNRAETARNRLRLKQRSVPDEDGFVMVTRGGRSGPARLEEAEKKKVELEERRKKNGVKDDFYRFQTREKRKEAEMALKRNFEADRKKIEEMRARRGKVRVME
ncbi:hypothetical protein M011DRAFT_491897 [Sporormia fimetaria CBS 119925]|uniref:Ribosomal RNA-processing protein 7 n=1 Tax=Sporormia fimetaria CBS 119925 TaxID=1340428 RepID=A0A6A6VNV0_9PLEO|nr:hypothetical protein M011DRAFT_491897 [Sporormia fimetaria CBS 119925]